MAKSVIRDAANRCKPQHGLTEQALLDDMRRYALELRNNPDAARQFLRDLGVLTTSGRARQLIQRPRR